MIRSFADKETEKIFNERFSKRLPADIQSRALRCLRYLDKARSLSVSPQYMRLIDGAIVASAMGGVDPQKFPDEISIAKKAIVRLMSNRLDAQHREELLVAAEALGLTEQANNLKSRISALNSNKNAVSGPSGLSYARSADIDMITKFFLDGLEVWGGVGVQKETSFNRHFTGHLSGGHGIGSSDQMRLRVMKWLASETTGIL